MVEEWTATGGTIEITSTISKNNSTATTENTNAEQIDGYNYLIIFKNITFKKPSGEQFYEEFRFGNFKPKYDLLNFAVFKEQIIEQCDDLNNVNNKNLTVRNGVTSMISFDNKPDLIQNVVTVEGSPRTSAISADNNLFFRIFTTNFDTTESKCRQKYLPTEYSQEWKAVSGKVEVVTTQQSSNVYIHKIYLVGIKFNKGNSEFYLGDKFYLGEYKKP